MRESLRERNHETGQERGLRRLIKRAKEKKGIKGEFYYLEMEEPYPVPVGASFKRKENTKFCGFFLVYVADHN